jgi:hypothetical protein
VHATAVPFLGLESSLDGVPLAGVINWREPR